MSGTPSGMMEGPNRVRASTARPRFGARTRMFEAGFGRSHGWRRPKCRLRRPVRRCLWPEGTGEASGLAGVAFLLVTFIWPRKEKSLAPARRAGETLSRATPSRPARRQPCQDTKPFTNPLIPNPSPARGEGSKDYLGNRPSPAGEKEAKTISGMIPSPVGRGSG